MSATDRRPEPPPTWEALRPRGLSVGWTLGRSMRVYARNFLPLLLLVLLFHVPQRLAGDAIRRMSNGPREREARASRSDPPDIVVDTPEAALRGSLRISVLALLGFLLAAAVAPLTIRSLEGHPPGAGVALALAVLAVLRALPVALALALLQAGWPVWMHLGGFGGWIGCVVVLALVVRCLPALPAATVERGNPLRRLASAGALTSRGPGAYVTLLFWTLVSCSLALSVLAPLVQWSRVLSRRASSAAETTAHALVLGFPAVVLAVAYHELRALRERGRASLIEGVFE